MADLRIIANPVDGHLVYVALTRGDRAQQGTLQILCCKIRSTEEHKYCGKGHGAQSAQGKSPRCRTLLGGI